MNLVKKTSHLGNFLKATSYVTCYPPPTDTLLVAQQKEITFDSPKYFLNAHSVYSISPSTRGLLAITGISVPSQYRYVHSDVQLPNLNEHRRPSTMNPAVPAKETYEKRRAFSYLPTSGALLFTALAVKTIVVKGVLYFDWNQDVVSLGTAEIKIGSIAEGRSLTFKWQGKPLFIKHRTEDEIETVRKMRVESLRDPETDESRVKDPKWLVCMGICTHLGCVPLHHKGENLGGFFCPCHGSHYDASGRVTNGPAPSNLEVPPYEFKDKNTLIVG